MPSNSTRTRSCSFLSSPSMLLIDRLIGSLGLFSCWSIGLGSDASRSLGGGAPMLDANEARARCIALAPHARPGGPARGRSFCSSTSSFACCSVTDASMSLCCSISTFRSHSWSTGSEAPGFIRSSADKRLAASSPFARGVGIRPPSAYPAVSVNSFASSYATVCVLDRGNQAPA